MKILYLIIILIFFTLCSCGSSNNFNSNNFQKRKNTRSWHFNKIDSKQLNSSKIQFNNTLSSKKDKKNFNLLRNESENITYAELGKEQIVRFDTGIVDSVKAEKLFPIVENTNKKEAIISSIAGKSSTEKTSNSKEHKSRKEARDNGTAKIVLLTILIILIAVIAFYIPVIAIGFIGGWIIVPAIIVFLGIITLLIFWIRNLYR